jgi:hypothetical protein
MFKSIVITVISGMLIFIPVQSYGQTQKEIAKETAKERKAIIKLSQAELNRKPSKEARKTAKRCRKEGWKALTGHLPMEKQFDRLYSMKSEYNEDNHPKYLIAGASSVLENYSYAKRQAIQLAMLELAEQIKSEIVAGIMNQISDTGTEEIAFIRDTLLAIPVSIGEVISVVEIYRTTGDKKEGLVYIACDSQMAIEFAKKAFLQKLEKRDDDLYKPLEKFLRLDK